MERVFEIADIITKFIEGKISLEEATELDRWLEQSPKNRQLFVSLLDEEIFEEEKTKFSPTKLDQIFLSIKTRKNRLRRRHYIQRLSAIAVCLTLIIGSILLFSKSESVILAEESAVKPIEKQNAWLKLASGQKIELSASVVDTLSIGDDSLQVILDCGKIQIASEDSLFMEEQYNVLEVAQGTDYNLILPDGSRVWLNANSKLIFPVCFQGDIRQVKLEGEAYFDVAHEVNRPFIVSSGNLDVKVLGTEFCVRDYQNKPALTTLIDGKVKVRNREGDWESVLIPGQQAVVFEGKKYVHDVETYYYTAWKDGYFAFKDVSIQDVMEELSAWYDFHCFFQDQKAADLKITARLKKYDSFDNLLNILSKMDEIKIEKNGNTIVIGSK